MPRSVLGANQNGSSSFGMMLLRLPALPSKHFYRSQPSSRKSQLEFGLNHIRPLAISLFVSSTFLPSPTDLKPHTAFFAATSRFLTQAQTPPQHVCRRGSDRLLRRGARHHQGPSRSSHERCCQEGRCDHNRRQQGQRFLCRHPRDRFQRFPSQERTLARHYRLRFRTPIGRLVTSSICI